MMMGFAAKTAQKGGLKSRLAPGPILAVASGKGGVGKTWLSTTLASAFARSGARTLLVDGDFGLANVDVQLGLTPQADLAAVIAGWIGLEDAVTPISGGAQAYGGFDVIAGRSGSGVLGEMSPDDVAQLAAGIQTLALHYERVIVDLAAGVDLSVMRLAKAADQVLIVATDEPTSMTDAYAFMKVLRGHAAHITPMIAVNMADRRATGRRTYDALAKACQTFLGFRPALAGIVARDAKVPDSIRAQTPIAVRHPQAQAFDDVCHIAEMILELARV